MTIADDGLELVESTYDIPTFQNQAEERAYWETHTFGDGLIKQMRPAREVDPRLPPPRAASSPITFRFEADVLHRLRKLAAAKGLGYQTLLKRFVIERLYDEERSR
ncbi:MAG: CopG family antitoxin [Chloroflexota bacterium]